MQVSSLLLLANALVFGFELWLGERADEFLQRWGLVSADFTGYLRGESAGESPAILVTVVTSAFLHAGWVHLLVNLLYLWVFGSALERVLGPRRLLAIYAAGVIAGGATHLAAWPQAVEPAVGASGGVAAVIAANLVLLPGATLGSLSPVLVLHSAANTPALLLLLVWLLAHVFVGAASVVETGTVGWWAHVGGFVSGLLLAAVLRPRHRLRVTR